MKNSFHDFVADDVVQIYHVSPEEHWRQVQEARRDAIRQELGVQRRLVRTIEERDEAITDLIDKCSDLADIYEDLANIYAKMADEYTRLAGEKNRLVEEYTKLAEKNATLAAQDPKISEAPARIQTLVKQLESIDDETFSGTDTE